MYSPARICVLFLYFRYVLSVWPFALRCAHNSVNARPVPLDARCSISPTHDIHVVSESSICILSVRDNRAF
ncbi:hypothetical protein EDB85DRAFT_1985457 [Lactarius pseudohatsudake]|nr:hypothetical protein EDB85DRAFT_1985457 [Lactarius pseudohatsudake]